MQFAVVEYTTKTGKVWRHTDTRPNYVCDPQKEIDPTSFGCYVSALKGEHVPLVGLITGPVINTPKVTVTYRKIYKRVTGSWPWYPLDYLKRFDVILFVHQLSDAHELAKAVERLSRITPRPFIIGVPTQPYGILKDAFKRDKRAEKNFVRFMNACDVVISLVADTEDWYGSMTPRPVEYLEQPYPVAFAQQHFKKRQQKNKTILVAGVTQRDNIKQGQEVAKRLQQRFPEYELLVPKVGDMEYDFTGLEGTRYRVLPFEPWQQHLETISKTMLVVNTDYTFTRGRVQVDCAAVGTPSIGANSDGQKDLFPDFMVKDCPSTDELVEQGSRLLSDPELYDKTITTASERLGRYDYEPSAERLIALVKQYGGRI